MLLTGILFSTMMLAAADGSGAAPKCSHLPRPDAPRAEPNDNQTPAGMRVGAVVTVRLVVRAASWYPDGPDGCGVRVNAFAEEGKAPRIPGPLVRVRAGTVLQIAIRNALENPIWVRGLRDQAEYARDSVEIAPGRTYEFRFRANGVGSFYYRARQLGNGGTQLSADIDGQLVGAYIVDPPDGDVADRVFVLTRWAQSDTAELKFELNAINGRSWPNTERLTLTVGDTVRWRVINGGNDFHMMHLHGFYFRILRGGVVGRDSVFPEERKRVVVTELLGPDGAFSLEWVPARAGNWIFHCHLARHMSVAQRLDRMPGANGGDAASMHEDHTNHAMSAMAGLIVGLTVKPRPNVQLAAEPRSRRTLQLFANERARVFGDRPGYGFVLQEGSRAPAPDSVRLPGTPIVLTRGQPAQIVVHNRLSTPIAVHWHGIELESYSDGVAGWSGSTNHIAPLIAPGDSFVARMTPPRAGTFIYHVHGGHADQLVSGLYGPLVVLEPGRTFDPLADLLFVLSEPGPGSRPGDEKAPFVNGSAAPPPVEMVAGRTYRLRFIGIPANDAYWTRLVSDSGLQQWRLIARDGADVSSSLTVAQRARFFAWAGTTRDFEFTPTGPGELTLELNVANVIAGRVSGRITRVPIRVRER